MRPLCTAPRLLTLALAAALSGCGTSDPSSDPEPSATPGAEEAAPSDDGVAPPSEDAELLYEFTVLLWNDRISGTRVFSDGRIQVGRGNQGEITWIDDRRATDDAIRELRTVLQGDAMKRLPEVLPDSPDATERAPRATWRFLVGDTLRTVTVERYAGVRIPELEQIQAVLARARTPIPLLTRWTLYTTDPPATFEVPCQPARTYDLRSLMAILTDARHPQADDTAESDLLLAIDYEQQESQWRIALTGDHRVVRTTSDGTMTTRQLDDDQWASLDHLLGTLDPETAPEACERLR